jgi:hypothetical protein
VRWQLLQAEHFRWSVQIIAFAWKNKRLGLQFALYECLKMTLSVPIEEFLWGLWPEEIWGFVGIVAWRNLRFCEACGLKKSECTWNWF